MLGLLSPGSAKADVRCAAVNVRYSDIEPRISSGLKRLLQGASGGFRGSGHPPYIDWMHIITK